MPVSEFTHIFLSKELKLLSTKRLKQGYVWEVEKRRQAFEVCPKCASPSNVRAGRVSVTVREEPLRDSWIWLKIHKHRYYCKSCKKPFTEPVSGIWPRKRTTQRFRKHIGKMCENFTNLSRVKNISKISNGLTYKIYYEQIEMKLRERRGIKWPTVLGIDEHFFSRSKGFTEYATVFTDLKKRKLFDMYLGKDVKNLIDQVNHIPGRDEVKFIAMDMSSSYKSFAQKMFPNAAIVSDKFHVLRLLTPAIMKIGKSIHGHRQELSTRRKLLRNRSKLDYFIKVEIDKYLNQHPELKEIYHFKERLFELYRCKGIKRALSSYHRLIEDMKSSSLEPVQRLRRTLIKWKIEILAYFETGYTNGLTEAINNLAKLVQRRGFGYKSFKNYKLRTLSACLLWKS
jgi:transposase